MKLLYHPAVLNHDTGAHPENIRRMKVFGDLAPVGSVPDGEEFIGLVHTADYIERLKRHCEQSLPLDADTLCSPDSFHAASTAVGLSVLAYRQNGFALLRPPGHHAYAHSGHGFCLFNNIAVAAQLAVQEGKKVLILDIDGHLGDGTMDIFYQNDRVMYWSLHQYPAYPGNGSPVETGEGAGKGYSMNIPLPAGSGDDIMLHGLDYLLPVAQQFEPDVVAVSAGFDAHQFDPMLQLKATGDFFYKVAQWIKKQFSVPIFAVMEGGYNSDVLPELVYNFLAGMNDEDIPHPEPPSISGMRTWETYEMYLHHTAALMEQYWKF